jgi:TrmH family RNA methyltransferase
VVYSSINNDKIKSIKKLYNKKYRDQNNMFLVEGQHLVEEAYKSNCLISIVILDGYDLEYDIDKIFVSDKVMKYLSELDKPTKYIGICEKKNNTNISDRLVILDDIQDPGNLGTIIRSSVAFNFNTILISKNSVDVYNSKVIRASQGMLFKVNVIVCDIEQEIKKLKDNGYSIVGTDVVNGSKVNEFAKMKKIAIIMGNEGNGLSSNIKKLCDEFIYIDMNSLCESLNVGVATSIIMYELNKE